MMKFPRHVRYTALRILKEKKYFHWLVAGRMARSDYAFLPQDLHWLVRRTPVLLGWPGVAGIGLLTACAAFYFSTIQQAQVKLASTRYSVLAIQDELKQAGHSPNANHTPEEQLDQFYRLFPQDKDLPQCMEKIFVSAQSHGVGLEQGEYKVTRDKEGGLVHFQMTFPVKGNYPQIRKFLTALKVDIPSLSLQQVQFQRQKVGDAMVEANIKLVLYFLEQKS